MKSIINKKEKKIIKKRKIDWKEFERLYKKPPLFSLTNGKRSKTRKKLKMDLQKKSPKVDKNKLDWIDEFSNRIRGITFTGIYDLNPIDHSSVSKLFKNFKVGDVKKFKFLDMGLQGKVKVIQNKDKLVFKGVGKLKKIKK